MNYKTPSLVIRALAGLAALCFLAAPANAAVEATMVAHPLLYKIEGEHSTVYLFGSIHVMKDRVKWLTDDLRKIFKSSDSLWLETTDIGDKDLMSQTLAKYAFNPQNNMTAGLSAEEVKKLEDILHSLHLDIKKMMGLKKWVVGLNIIAEQTKQLGYEPRKGVDVTFLEGAKLYHKKLHGFESGDYEISLLAAENDKDDIAQLRAAMKESDETKKIVPEAFDAWAKGDEKSLNKLINGTMKSEDKKEYEKLIVQRNNNWEPQIESLIDFGTETTFVVVGAGHLVGPDGLVSMLLAQGYTVERVKD